MFNNLNNRSPIRINRQTERQIVLLNLVVQFTCRVTDRSPPPSPGPPDLCLQCRKNNSPFTVVSVLWNVKSVTYFINLEFIIHEQIANFCHYYNSWYSILGGVFWCHHFSLFSHGSRGLRDKAHSFWEVNTSIQFL